MDPLDNLRDVWQRLPQPPAPDVRTVIAAARRGRLWLTTRLVIGLASLLGTMVFIGWGMAHWQFAYPSTKAGMALMLLAIVAAVAANSSLLRLLLGRVDSAVDNRAYLDQLRRYQHRQHLFHTTGMRVYMLLLGVGMGLYLFEFVMRNWWFGLIAYAATAFWFAVAWFYLTPRTIRRQTRVLNELIEQVERIGQQF